MDGTVYLKIKPVFNNPYDIYTLIDNPTFASAQERPKVIKYTKLPEHDAVPTIVWQDTSSQPLVRRIVELPQEIVPTTRSLKPDLYRSSNVMPYSSKRKVVNIDEDDEKILHTSPGKNRKSTGCKSSNRPVQKHKPEKVQMQRNTSRLYNTDSPRPKRNMGQNSRHGKKKHASQGQTEKHSPQHETIKSVKSVNVQKSNSTKSSPKDIIKKNRIDKTTKNTIQVPIENVNGSDTVIDMQDFAKDNYIQPNMDFGTDTKITQKDMNIATVPKPEMVSKVTEITNDHFNFIKGHCKKSEVDCQTNYQDITLPIFESLHIPEVSLIKEKTFELSEDKTISIINNLSLPKLTIPSLKISKIDVDKKNVSGNHSQYIISHAVVTYTTKQKIDLKVVGCKDIVSQIPPPVTQYPLNVVSILKKEIKQKKCESSKTLSNIPKQLYSKSMYNTNDLETSINYAFNQFNNNKLMKPSDIISTITHNDKLFTNSFISEQFQKELDFIDSFVESLQYLENCSLSKKPLSDIRKSYNDLIKGQEIELEYNAMLAQHELFVGNKRQKTASKSLCLLNMLICDEQRRAKNLLFVLKMREDALKDFTKSQILWLENKKKLDNNDASTLKKKQRGALVKLQHECGEMERMRKALVSLSEKRKAVLLKTKKSIELQLSGKVKVRKSDRKKKSKKSNPAVSPVRHHEFTTTNDFASQVCSDSLLLESDQHSKLVTCAEKSIQTGDSILGTLLIDRATNTTADSFVLVEGGYLNILFHTLALPNIFCDGKQYEVNEEALRNILTSSNVLRENASDNNVIEKLIDQLRNGDGESTPSTARSLVDEFDQYYKDMDKQESSLESECVSAAVINDDLLKDLESFDNETLSETQLNEDVFPDYVNNLSNEMENICIESCSCSRIVPDKLVSGIQVSAIDSPMLYELSSMPAMGEWQPVTPQDIANISTEEASTVETESPDSSMSMTNLALPAVSEAEELRRQQLAIEQEIKVLEEQQCQLVVREIPDKPPPPYQPPAAPFRPDQTLAHKVNKHLHRHDVHCADDPYEHFIKDFCHEIRQRQTKRSEQPWDASNVEQKVPRDTPSLQSRTTQELKEVLSGVTPNLVGLGNRRSDHIDDILFNEWRRCETEWTSLHVDEANVKNQLLEDIFEQLISETMDEYKKIIAAPPVDDESAKESS